MTTKSASKISIKDFLETEYHKLIRYVRLYFNENYYGFDAEDIVQDVALNIYSKADINSPIENLTSYFYRSIRNRIVDIQRKAKKNTSYENFTETGNENFLEKESSDDKNDTKRHYETEEYFERLYEALNKLKPEEKSLIIEIEFNKKTFDQLSQEWGVPIGTLLARKHRTLNKLYKLINKT
ncbi:MAG: sigma-70 family RNA polymerase sigma factor [Bacteroidales bacterium]|nr:sigma-70 family RNA polymerase sigma factor [Bacteroidales bacterium]